MPRQESSMMRIVFYDGYWSATVIVFDASIRQIFHPG